MNNEYTILTFMNDLKKSIIVIKIDNFIFESNLVTLIISLIFKRTGMAIHQQKIIESKKKIFK